MIMGDICTRRCPFCDVSHGKPLALDEDEPQKIAEAIAQMKLKYVVITSVDRDDLRDGGAEHFAKCIKQAKAKSPSLQVEVLVPDFRGRMEVALDKLGETLPEVFNHNLETVPRLYKEARPGSSYQWSLDLIKKFKARYPTVKTKSGLMVGLGETIDEIKEVIQDLHNHNCDMLTIGQYLQPTSHHLPVKAYLTPDEFKQLETFAYQVGFSHVASGPMVRSSYHADLQASTILNGESNE
jgi:lipoic acid synthetase